MTTDDRLRVVLTRLFYHHNSKLSVREGKSYIYLAFSAIKEIMVEKEEYHINKETCHDCPCKLNFDKRVPKPSVEQIFCLIGTWASPEGGDLKLSAEDTEDLATFLCSKMEGER